jgi:hypothetical protein
MMDPGRSYTGVNMGKAQPGLAPWICARLECDEARPGNLPRPICCPRCGASVMRAGPYLAAHPRENVVDR